jgi:radical SAM/Cys-rich protein
MSIVAKEDKAKKKSLHAQSDPLADVNNQLNLLHSLDMDRFDDHLKKVELYPLKPTQIAVFQMNLGYMCNQVCKHCHVDAGPDRKEIMTLKTMEVCLDVIRKNNIQTVDLTGGAPEMNPNFRWFVEEVSTLGVHIIVRCNLTIILANKKYNDLPEFFKKHKVEVASSLPHYTSTRTDSQRGEGVFGKSIEALKMLNSVGYGVADSGLILNLVYNPTGAILPGNQQTLENDFKQRLERDFQLVFNHLFVITNIPISRFLDYLHASGNLEDYMEKLITSFNPSAAQDVMCRNTISVSWDGFLYDCDFNQMLEMKVDAPGQHISTFNVSELEKRSIRIDQHCFGCTAGSGSSCGGQLS